MTQLPSQLPPPLNTVTVPATEAAMRCRWCHELIQVPYTYCPHCGRRLALTVPWFYRPGWILVLALVALGPFALGLVWRSPLMQRSTKWAMTAAILAATIGTCYLGWAATAAAVSTWKQTMGDLGGLSGF